MQYPYAQPYTPIATRKSPGIAMRCEGATHNQEEFILRVVRSIQIILCSIAVAMKRLPHPCTHSYMTRETTGVNGDGSSQRHTLTLMIFRRNTDYAPILHLCLLDSMPSTQCCSVGNSPTCKV